MKGGWKANQLLSLIILVSVTVSVVSLFRQSIRLDEAQSIWMFTKSISTMLQITSQDVNLPLYGIILHFWLQIFGNEIMLARILSLLFFVITLPILYVTVRDSSNEKTALVTVALFSFSPFVVWYTSEARTYTLFALITILNHYFFLKLTRSKGERGKFGLFISMTAGLYTHYFFLFFLAAQMVYVTLRMTLDINNRYQGWVFFLLLGSALCLFCPWIVYVVQEGSVANTQPLIPPPTSYNVIQAFVYFIFGFQNQKVQSVLISLWPLSLILLFLIFSQRRKTKIRNFEYFILVTFLPITLVFLASLIRPIFLPRYLILVTPSLFLLIAWMLLNHPRRVSFYLTTISLVLMFGMLLYQNISAATPVKEDYQGVTRYLDKAVTAKDIVAVSAPFTVYPIEYLYEGGARLATIPDWDRYVSGSIPAYSRQRLIGQISNYKQNYDRLFVVLSYDQGYETDLVDYLDHNLERLEMRKFSEAIELRVYKLRY